MQKVFSSCWAWAKAFMPILINRATLVREWEFFTDGCLRDFVLRLMEMSSFWESESLFETEESKSEETGMSLSSILMLDITGGCATVGSRQEIWFGAGSVIQNGGREIG